MVFGVNGVNAVGTTTNVTGIKQQEDSGFGNIPIGQNGNHYRQKVALNNFENAVKAGNVKFEEPNLLARILGSEDNFKITIDDKNTTLGDVKILYNLPDGALTEGGNIIDDYGGNRDLYKVPIGADNKPYIRINAKDLSTATGISEENLKNMLQ